ncbi:hypothetical protein SDC9_37174 [bioreactor metagenome]|uniref:Uncharacterized protein n=1 Tax=bioreactor metagenome TaxID=1076179 RepID=A0A644VIJ0_9ZZZZ
MIAAAAEPRRLAAGEKAGDRPAVGAKRLPGQVGFDPPQRLARQHMQPHRDQRSGRRIEDPVRPRRAHQPVAEIGARTAQRGDLHILGEGVCKLAVARLDLRAQMIGLDRPRADPVHPGHQLVKPAGDDEILAVPLERLEWRRRGPAKPAAQEQRDVLAGEVGVLLRPRERKFLLRDRLGGDEPGMRLAAAAQMGERAEAVEARQAGRGQAVALGVEP